MSSRIWLPVLAAVAVATSAACGGNPKPQTPPVPAVQRPGRSRTFLRPLRPTRSRR